MKTSQYRFFKMRFMIAECPPYPFCRTKRIVFASSRVEANTHVGNNFATISNNCRSDRGTGTRGGHVVREIHGTICCSTVRGLDETAGSIGTRRSKARSYANRLSPPRGGTIDGPAGIDI